MSENLSSLVGRLRGAGIRLSVEGGRLVVDCDPELMTDELRAQISPQKMAIILYLQRSAMVGKRLGHAMLDAEKLFPDRFDWCRSNAEVTAAAADVDRAITSYVEGAGSMGEVQQAWKMYTRTIDTTKERR